MVKPLIDARDRYEKMKQTEELKVRAQQFYTSFLNEHFLLVDYCSTASTSAIDCSERLVSKMTCGVAY